jgi:hypothetical protein
MRRESEEAIEERNKEIGYLKKKINIMKFQQLGLRKVVEINDKWITDLRATANKVLEGSLEVQQENSALRVNVWYEDLYLNEINKLHCEVEELKYELSASEYKLDYLKEKFNIELDLFEDQIIECYPDDSEKTPEFNKKRNDICILCNIRRRAVVFMNCTHCVLCVICFMHLSQPRPVKPKYRKSKTFNKERVINCPYCGKENDKCFEVKFS